MKIKKGADLIDYIEEKRLKQNISIERISKVVNIHKTTYYRFLDKSFAGRKLKNLDVFLDIARELDLEITIKSVKDEN